MAPHPYPPAADAANPTRPVSTVWSLTLGTIKKEKTKYNSLNTFCQAWFHDKEIEKKEDGNANRLIKKVNKTWHLGEDKSLQ